MQPTIIVPARLASVRFPRKLLHPVLGRPVILWTARRLRQVAPEMPLFFAVDGEELKQVLEAEGYEAILTDPQLPSGTDRIAAANRSIGAEQVINVQADEPLVAGAQLRQLAELIGMDVDMATLGTPLRSEDDFRNPNQVKCVCNATGQALFFSRSPIPFFRDAPAGFDPGWAASIPVLIHLGVYAYRAELLERFASMPPGQLEAVEKLEMLRVLEAGGRIQVGVTDEALVAVDTPEQLGELEEALRRCFPEVI